MKDTETANLPSVQVLGWRLSASLDYCWHSWVEQTESMGRLLSFTFDWVLPGHGQRVRLPVDEMRRQLVELVERMRAGDR